MNRNTSEVIIVGAGPAGLHCAIEFARIGIHSRVVDPIFRERGGIQFDLSEKPVVSALPVIRQDVAEQMGVAVVRPLTHFEVLPGVVPPWLILGRLGPPVHPRVAVSTAMLQSGLLSQLPEAGGRVNLEEGTVTSADVRGDKVTSIEIASQTGSRRIYADYFIDATGRSAQLSKQINRQHRDGVIVRSFRAPSTILGGRIQMDLRQLDGQFSSDTISIGLTPRRIAVALMAFNVAATNDRQEVLVYAEGAQNSLIGSSRSERGSVDSRRLQVLQAIFSRTAFNPLERSFVQMNQSLYLSYPGPEYRISRLTNLALVGDAQGHTDPLYAGGVKHAVLDVQSLVGQLNQHEELDSAFVEYNSVQIERYRKLIGKSMLAYRFRQALFTTESLFSH